MLHSGKNNKPIYYLCNYAQMLVPDVLYRRRLPSILKSLNTRSDRGYILDRVNYYCRLTQQTSLGPDSRALYEHKPGTQKVYFFDAHRYTRYFPSSLRWTHIDGDVTTVQPYPTIVKSRPIYDDNSNNILLKLNAIRHFIYIKDKLSFADKLNIAIFRGKVKDKPLRKRFFQQYFGNPLCDLGDTSKAGDNPPEWKTPKISIYKHLQYRYILALEGNDVASNLKWVMSSNSLAVTTKPRFETWFMEGRLKAGVHYVEIKDDFSNLEEKIDYYNAHIREAQRIIDNAHAWVEQFRDRRREQLISLLVLEKYFRMTGQL